jgi:hypothetical protein
MAGDCTTGETDMTTEQPEALRLAEILEGDYCPDWLYERGVDEVSAELRTQHARITELEAQLEAVGAGGVGPLMGIAAPPTAQAEGWRPIETAPKDGRALLLGHFNSHGKWRTVRGQWFSADEIAETFENPDGCDEGWFETVVESDDIPNCWATEPTHWMPLPLPPKEAL